MTTRNDKALMNLKRSKNHLDKIIDMIENKECCIDVIQQINAVLGYLNSAKARKIESHMHTCFVNNMASNKEKGKTVEMIDEVLRAMKMAS